MEEPADDDDTPLLGKTGLGAAVVIAVAITVVCWVVMPPVTALLTGVLALTMVLITLIDARHFIIPDVLSLPAIPLGIIANIAVFHGDDWTTGLIESALGAILAGGCFYLLRALWFQLRKVEGLGLGDVKLAAAAGAWLGPALLAPACLASALAGLVAVAVMALLPGRRLGMADEIPFGSFIAPVILLFWILRTLDFVPLP